MSATQQVRWCVVFVVAVSVGCSRDASPNIDETAEWRAETSFQNGVEIVRTLGGSVWPSKAHLVEELSIGLERGPDEYMFGGVRSIFATEREIFVLDAQVPALRVYDFEGHHLRDIGREGQGPGEFRWPAVVTGTDGGNLFVFDMVKLRSINRYDATGRVLDPIPLDKTAVCCVHPIVALDDASVWVEVASIDLYSADRLADAVQRYSADGPSHPARLVPRLELVPRTFSTGNGFRHPAPLAPSWVWAISSSGALISGASSQYEFEIQRADGSRTRVMRDVEPVRVLDSEAEWHRKYVEAVYGWTEAGRRVDLTWDRVIPSTKPAFDRFVPTASGELWVFREGPSDPIPDCTVGPIRRSGFARSPPRCHAVTRIVDVFDLQGRYLGEVDYPAGTGLSPVPFVRDDLVITAETDTEGVQRVKVLRLEFR